MKMNKRDYFEAIKFRINGENCVLTDSEIIEFLDKVINTIDSRKQVSEEKSAAEEAFMSAILSVLDTEFYKPAVQVEHELNNPAYNAAKIRYRLNKLYQDGVAEKDDIAYEGKTLKGYKLKG